MATDADATDRDPTGNDGTAQLQRAAREVLGAARSFLDAVEELVEDRDKLHGAVETVTGVVGDLVAKVSPNRPSPWGEPEDPDDGWTDDGWSSDGWSNESGWRTNSDSAGEPGAEETSTEPDSTEPDSTEPAAKKVRKIQVD